ncbi:Acg family FMN-binding oxidoreductase [Nocardia sp. NPDC056000]|uniref:Acg family FMN-binding oxidoreductase n=1 Tax=Nocardia sp. NPDC056000 TaxID=3345674 RepID=UPI0035DB7805
MIDRSALAQAFETAVGMAARAPSIHNTQPWRWRLDDDVINLFADPERHLPAADPDSRGLVMSCGAALHHLRVALAVLGWRSQVKYLPDAADPNHLAAVTVTPHPPEQGEIELAAAIVHRQSDRRRFGPRLVTQSHLRRMSAVAPHFGAAARQVPASLRGALAEASYRAADRHALDPRYRSEMARWSGRHGSPDGVPAASAPPARTADEIMLRTFASPELSDVDTEADSSEWLVICTPADDRRAHLRAGEAASALLLTASSLTLSSCLQSEPLAMPDLAAAIRTEVLQDAAYPQAMVRVGWAAAGAAPLPLTPRRPADDVIDVS